MSFGFRWGLLSSVAALAVATIMAPVRADTLEGALILAYQNNPSLNSQRAAVRATDEGVSQALAGYRPRITANGSIGELSQDSTTKLTTPGLANPYVNLNGTITPITYGITATQMLFDGFQTANKTRQAESNVYAAREVLRSTEQATLLNAATAYMNMLRDTAILDLQKRNVEVLQEQLRQTRDRFNVGEVTRTDVAQSESALAAGRSSVLTAESNYKTSAAIYRQVIGKDPSKLQPATPVDRFSPQTEAASVTLGTSRHPNVVSAQYNVDAALNAVKVAEGALYPNVSLQGSVQKSLMSSITQIQTLNSEVLGVVSMPIYQGGAEYSAIRQAKETLGQRRIDLDTARDQVRQTVVQSWGQLEAAKANIEATQAQVQSSEIALNGVREEARVGQRTTLDVLNAQQTLVNARVSLVSAQRDRVVASYTLLSAVGRLTPAVLGLHVPTYDPQVHYHQVRDAWIGVRTPDGR
ncbi:MAG: Type I secretion outer membrane protein, TolC family [Pseudolabrys sp.]|jgi:outer membrane protein|nr:Type I secretion outer membrane protein, TolC family [Pseudolabrys sp.]